MHTQKWKDNWKKPRISHNKLTKYNFLVSYPKRLKLGKYIDIGQFVYIQAEYGVEIEDEVQIGGGCMIYSCSTIDDKRGKIHICKGAKVGTQSTIMPNITIGERAIVGAHSFVNKDVPAYSLVTGIPAKLKRNNRKISHISRIPLNPDEIKSHIKVHYEESVGWREGFKSSKNDSWLSRGINYLKRNQLQVTINYFDNLNGKIILDAGCGNGEYSLSLAKKFPEAKIYSVDFSKTMCELTKERANKEGIKNIIVNEGDIENLSFEDNFFDVVLCVDTLHHIPDSSISKGLNELKRVTKMNGTLIVDFKNRNNPLLYYQHQKKNRITYYRTNRTLKEMKRILEKEDVKVVKAKGLGGAYLIAPYVTLFCKKSGTIFKETRK